MPLSTFDRALLPHEEGKTVVVYCRSGRRSGQVMEQLAGLGDVKHMQGGINAWVQAGLPVMEGAR